MAKIIVAGDAVVIQSGRTLEEIKKLEKYAPKSLYLYEEDEDGKKFPVFKVATTCGAGSASKYGVCFGSAAHDGSGLATITEHLPEGIGDAKEWIMDEYGVAVVQLNKVEEGFDAALAEVDAAKAAVEANIEGI